MTVESTTSLSSSLPQADATNLKAANETRETGASHELQEASGATEFSLADTAPNTAITGEFNNYTDGSAHEVPRTFLTLQQAATVLGKSIRTLERSLAGKWGAKLPDGWVGRKLRTELGEEWRILPPPGFRVNLKSANSTVSGGTTSGTADSGSTEYDTSIVDEYFALTTTDFSPNQKKRRFGDAVVVDRAEEVEILLRELVATQRALAEERRLHLEDLRTIHQLQSSVRLLEVNSADQAKTKQELESAKSELNEWKQKFEQLVKAPWWRKLFN